MAIPTIGPIVPGFREDGTCEACNGTGRVTKRGGERAACWWCDGRGRSLPPACPECGGFRHRDGSLDSCRCGPHFGGGR
jgi:DnaJ-class molecular chaperone